MVPDVSTYSLLLLPRILPFYHQNSPCVYHLHLLHWLLQRAGSCFCQPPLFSGKRNVYAAEGGRLWEPSCSSACTTSLQQACSHLSLDLGDRTEQQALTGRQKHSKGQEFCSHVICCSQKASTAAVTAVTQKQHTVTICSLRAAQLPCCPAWLGLCSKGHSTFVR